MTAEITSVVGQLSISGGKSRPNAPNQIAVREPKSADAPGAGKGDLFIITEVQGNVTKRDVLEKQLTQAIRDTYYLSRGSITASLRRAMQAGSDLLYYRNQHKPSADHIIGGAVVLVTNGEEAFVAQIGPTAFFAVLGDHIRRYPAHSIWLDENTSTTAQDEETSALGQDSVIEPGLHHLRVGVQDKLVLTDSRLSARLPLRELVHAVDPGNVKSAIKKLTAINPSPSASAIVLEVVAAKTKGLGSLKISAPKISTLAPLSNFLKRKQVPPKPVLKPVTAQVTSTLEPTMQAPGHTSAVFTSTSIMQKSLQWLGGLASSTPARATESQPGPPVSVPLEADVTPYQPPEDNDMRLNTNEQQFEADPMRSEATFRPETTVRQETPSTFQKIVPGIGIGLFTLIALLGTGLKNIFNMLLPGVNDEQNPRQAGMQAQHQPPSNASLKLLRNIAIAIPILAIIVVIISYLQNGRIREAEYTEYVTIAQQKFEQAQAVEPSAALGLMTEAEASLLKAEEIKQDQPEIAELRQQMAEKADLVGNVQRLYYLPQLRQYADTGTFTDKIIVQGLDVYVLDSGNDRIFHHQLNDLGEALLPDDQTTVMMATRGQVVEDVTVSELLDMAWMPTGGNRQTSDLVILNSTGLLEYNSNWGITSAALVGTEELIRPAAVDSFFGNFYVLDVQANKLLRYLPAHDGYSLPPESYFPNDQSVNLTNAVDMAIDGAIYILYQDGRISKFLGGQLDTEFNVTGLDIPFNNPVAMFTAPDEDVQFIYVADAGNHRIVQLDKDGSFVRQFKPRLGEAVSFSNLQDIFVDEIGGRMYVLDSNSLYLTNLPTNE